MKSGTPKVLHPLCGRPMLAYVLDAWAEAVASSGTGRTTPPPTYRPIVVYSPADRCPDRGVRRRASSSRSRTSRAAPATRCAPRSPPCPADATEVVVLSGDVPLVDGPDLAAVLEARREDDAAIALASVFAADPARLGRVVRGEFGTGRADRRGEGRHRRRARDQRGQRRAVRVRRRVAPAPDRRRSARPRRPASCT